jgi:hypothetical protein
MPLAVVLGDLLYLFWEAEMQKIVSLGHLLLSSSNQAQIIHYFQSVPSSDSFPFKFNKYLLETIGENAKNPR